MGSELRGEEEREEKKEEGGKKGKEKGAPEPQGKAFPDCCAAVSSGHAAGRGHSLCALGSPNSILSCISLFPAFPKPLEQPKRGSEEQEEDLLFA